MVAHSICTDMRAAPGRPPIPDHYDRVIELIRTAESLGYRTVWASEQHGMDDGYMPASLIALSALARETTTIRLGSGVHLLTLSHPRRVVQEAALVDVLSRGRVTLGLGAGGDHPHEFRIYGRRREDRAQLMEDGLAFVRQALSGGDAPDGFPINVPPVQAPLPVVVGGLVRPAIDRAVRLADGHFSYSFIDPDEELPALWRERIAPALERHDRKPEDFHLALSTVVWASEDYEEEWRDHVGPAFRYQQRRYAEWAGGGEQDLPEFVWRPSSTISAVRERMLVGPPAEIAERLSAIRSVYPFDEIAIWPALPGVQFELAERCLRTFASEVVPYITESVPALQTR